MAKHAFSLNLSLISFLLFAVSPNNFVNSAAVEGGARCGYGYQQCQDGYECVKQNRYARTCQEISSDATPTYGSLSWSGYSAVPTGSASFSSLAGSAGLSSKPAGYTRTLDPQSHNSNVTRSHTSEATSTSTSTSTPPDPANNFTAVVGVPDKVVERRPIDVLQNIYPDVFNMLVLAFESMQEKDESHDLSYYQLSGIHGFPFISWQYPPRNPSPQRGYCTHQSSIFTTWHRPYVALLEQTLYEEAVSIAKRFTGPDASKYQAAAEEVRLPYWDWASDDTDSRLPKAVAEPSIAVVKPGSAGPTTIPNPLYSYRRRDIGTNTVRGQTAEADLMATFPERQSLTNALFTDTTYNDFSSNLEDIHGLVHVLIGGDMVSVARAAYDPVFWFHHCNVDRLMAMFQAAHPDLYLSPAPRTPTYALDAPGTDDLFTPLYPFRHPDSKEWTSDDVKSVESIFKLGYAYPEVPSGRSGEDLKTFSIQKVNELYGPKTEDISFQGEFSGVPELPNARREWNANVVVDSSEIPGSQQIRLFLGDSGKNDTGSLATDDLAGVAAIFSSNLTSADSSSRLLNITVPLTQVLIDKRVGLSPEDAVPKLASDLHWAVEQVGDTKTPIPVQDLKSLQISVTSQVTDYPEDNTKLPVKSEPRTFLAPTDDKVGGLQSGQAPPVDRPANNGTARRL